MKISNHSSVGIVLRREVPCGLSYSIQNRGLFRTSTLVMALGNLPAACEPTRIDKCSICPLDGVECLSFW